MNSRSISLKKTSTEKMTPIKFGTDGWRAVIEENFTFANLERVAQAFADYINDIGAGNPRQLQQPDGYLNNFDTDATESVHAQKIPYVIVGYDKRFFFQRVCRAHDGSSSRQQY